MSFERDVNVSVQMMFKHAKAVISKNLRNAVRQGQLTLEQERIPGLELLISRSIDEACVQSGKELNRLLEVKAKKLDVIVDEAVQNALQNATLQPMTRATKKAK